MLPMACNQPFLTGRLDLAPWNCHDSTQFWKYSSFWKETRFEHVQYANMGYLFTYKLLYSYIHNAQVYRSKNTQHLHVNLL